jgi:hypothetical protein
MNGTHEKRALAAADAVAAAHGLEHDEAAVIYSGSNVVVHLRPTPVVARVMTGTVALHDDPRRWLEREVSVLEFLAPSGIAVAPSCVIAAGPHWRDGLWMTFAEWIPDVAPQAPLGDAGRLGRALRELHDELRPFDGDLGDLRTLRENTERLLGLLRPVDRVKADAITSLRTRFSAVSDVVFESSLPIQALHGDVSLTNLLHTPQRLVWNDFEDTFRGPVGWDVASFVISLRTRGADSYFIERMLDAYGWNPEQALAPYIAAHNVYDEIWRLYDRQRRGPSTPASSRDLPPR